MPDKKLLKNIKSSEEYELIEQQKITDDLKEEQAKLLEENSFSIELLQNSKYKSLEEMRFAIIKEIIALLSETNNEKIPQIRKKLKNFISHNNLLLGIIFANQNWLKLEEAKEKQYTKLKKDLVDSDKKANNLIKGYVSVIPSILIEEEQLKDFLNKGCSGLDDIEDRLSKIEDLDFEKIKNLGFIWMKLQELKGVIEKQTKIATQMSGQKNEEKLKEMAKELFDALHTEIVDYNNILREYYSRINLRDENDRLTNLIWLNQKEKDIMGDTLLFLKQFEIPKIDLPCGVYVSYSCTSDEAKSIIKNAMISKQSARLGKLEIMVGSSIQDFNYVEYIINDIEKEKLEKNHQTCFIFPLEGAIKKKFFIVNDFSKGNIVMFDRFPKAESLLTDIEKTMQRFDILVKHINDKYKEWVDQAKELNRNFVTKWDIQAEANVNNNFTKRWIKEESQSFSDVNQFSFDIVKFIVDLRYFSVKFNNMFDKKKDERPKTQESYLEEMQAMSKDEFVKIIKLGKKLYENMLGDIRSFMKGVTLDQPITDGIFVAPKSKVLFWEKYFLNATRPNTFYYHGEDLSAGLKECIASCKKNKKDRPVPKAKFVRIYSYVDSQPLQTF